MDKYYWQQWQAGAGPFQQETDTGPSMNGKTYSRDVIDGREFMSGMIFFNELGDEVGGLIYAGIKKDSVNYSAVGHLSFDQWQQMG